MTRREWLAVMAGMASLPMPVPASVQEVMGPLSAARMRFAWYKPHGEIFIQMRSEAGHVLDKVSAVLMDTSVPLTESIDFWRKGLHQHDSATWYVIEFCPSEETKASARDKLDQAFGALLSVSRGRTLKPLDS